VPGKPWSVYVAPAAELTDKDVQSAEVATDSGRPTVDVVLTPAGARKLAQLTAAHIDEPLAMFVDGKIVSAPLIKDRIPTGRLRLFGQFTEEAAARIAAGFNSGERAEQRAEWEGGRYRVVEPAAQTDGALEGILEGDPARHEQIGLQLILRADREVYSAGDPIWLSVYLVNVGDQQVTVYAPQTPLLPPAPIEVVRWSIKGSETVSRPEGEPLGMSLNVPVPGKVVVEELWTALKPGLDDFTSVSPREEVWLWSANVADERFRPTWGKKPNLHDLRTPGEYVLRTRYSNSLTGEEFGLNAWVGGLRSDELRIVVE